MNNNEEVRRSPTEKMIEANQNKVKAITLANLVEKVNELEKRLERLEEKEKPSV